jgi:ribosomal protein L15
LWNGKIDTKVTVHVDKASASAKEAIEKAWGELVLK